MSEEWTKWQDHDGKGCPCPGMWVMAEFSCGDVEEGLASSHGLSWVWDDPDPYAWNNGVHQIIRYRIRRPKALQQLIHMVETLPAHKPTYEDA